MLIVADDNANPVYVAADLLSQAEHDELAMPILVTTSEELGEQVIEEVHCQISDLNRKNAKNQWTFMGLFLLSRI